MKVRISDVRFSTIIFLFFHSLFNGQLRPDALYGDYNGYWMSTNSTGTVSRETNNLIGFTIGSTIYATGADNTVLTSHGITNFINENYRAFPTSFSVVTPTNNFLIGQPAYVNGVLQTAANSPSLSCDLSLGYYLRDGKNGLDLSTAVFNIPKQELSFYVNVLADINPSCINDAIPDIIVTQVGEPSTTFDIFKFTDINGVTVGVEKQVAFSSSIATSLGKAQWNFYSASCPRNFNSGSSFANTSRDVRVLTFKLSDFGITPSNYTSAVKFVQVLSGDSDVAFSAYSTNSMSLYCLENGVNSGVSLDTKIGISTQGRASTVTENWPMIRKGGFLALESNKKPFVPTRLSTVNLVNITNPVAGMMVYDTTENCLKIYVNSTIGWKCFNKKTCP